MDVKGKLHAVLPAETGTGKNGEWKKQNIVLETDGQYPKKIAFELWGDKIPNPMPGTGSTLTVHFDPESREYNGRWYTTLRGWKVQVDGAVAAQATTQEQAPPPPSADEDLPF